MKMPSLIDTLKTCLKYVKRILKSFISYLVRIAIFITLLTIALWAGLLLWTHLNDYPTVRVLSVVMVAGLFTITLIGYCRHATHWKKWLYSSGVVVLPLVVWFVWLPAKQDRAWQAEVSQMISFEQSTSNPDIITLYNVRDFVWARTPDSEQLVQPQQPYFYKVVKDGDDSIVATERWTTREIDLSKLNGIDFINSYWMGEPIGHTLVSFRFEGARPLTFSIEIRKEQDESFSAIGGFFKQFEMIVVAAEERDIVYTRSNARGEQVYLLPIEGMSQRQARALFMAYLNLAEALQHDAKWYNTLIRNCTTKIFDMTRDIDASLFPRNYRILVSGYLPNYLYDEGRLPKLDWGIDKWYRMAHINPKVADLSVEDNQASYVYSQKARENLPAPPLTNEEFGHNGVF